MRALISSSRSEPDFVRNQRPLSCRTNARASRAAMVRRSRRLEGAQPAGAAHRDNIISWGMVSVGGRGIVRRAHPRPRPGGLDRSGHGRLEPADADQECQNGRNAIIAMPDFGADSPNREGWTGRIGAPRESSVMLDLPPAQDDDRGRRRQRRPVSPRGSRPMLLPFIRRPCAPSALAEAPPSRAPTVPLRPPAGLASPRCPGGSAAMSISTTIILSAGPQPANPCASARSARAAARSVAARRSDG